MSDNFFRSQPSAIRGHSGGAAAGRRHPSANDYNGYEARLNNTPRIESYQTYTQLSRTPFDYQVSQAPGQYLPDVVFGDHPAQHQQHIPWPQHSYQGMDAPSYQMEECPQIRRTLDDQYREIGGQFGPPRDPSGPTQDQQGAWNSKRSMHGVGGMFFDENALAHPYEVPPTGGEDVRHHSDYSNANVSRLGSIDGQQQSMLMASLGRQPGYQEELRRAMSDIPPNQIEYTSANGTINMSPSASAGDGDYAGVFGLQEHGPYPFLQQHNFRNGVVPDIVLSRPGESECWDREPQAILTQASQPRGRSGPQFPGRSAPSSTSVVVGNALRCSHEGCKSEFNKSWGKGNLARHLRMKHKDGGRRYICQVGSCASVFQRSDARLKHYRKEHPELVKKPMRPRKASNSTGTGSGWEHLGGSPHSNSLTSPSGSQALDDFETASSSYDIDGESCHGSLFHP